MMANLQERKQCTQPSAASWLVARDLARLWNGSHSKAAVVELLGLVVLPRRISLIHELRGTQVVTGNVSGPGLDLSLDYLKESREHGNLDPSPDRHTADGLRRGVF
jgi:hypothetical protein